MVARVLVGCSGQLLVLLSVCQGVLDGCQAVAMWLLGCLGLFIACKKKLPSMLGCLLEVVKVLLGSSEQLLVLLCVCQGVSMWLLGCFGWFLACAKLPAMLGC